MNIDNDLLVFINKCLRENIYTDNIVNFEIYLKINYPILFSFTFKNNKYLVYILTCKQIKKELEFIMVNTTDDELLRLLNQERDLLSILTMNDDFSKKDKIIYFHNTYDKVNKKDIIYKSINKDKDYIDKLPSPDFMLTKLIVNEICLDEAKKIIIERNNK